MISFFQHHSIMTQVWLYPLPYSQEDWGSKRTEQSCIQGHSASHWDSNSSMSESRAHAKALETHWWGISWGWTDRDFLKEMTYDLGFEEWAPGKRSPKGMEQSLRGNHLSKGVAWENTVGVNGRNASGWLQRGKQKEIKWKCQPALMLCSVFFPLCS